MPDPNVPGLFGQDATLALDNTTAPTEDPFWLYSDSIAGVNWNASFPYQLLVLAQDPSSGTYQVTDTFTLPLPPQDIGLDTPFAITTTVTLGGIVEQHNGAPLRMLTLQGTTGVFPLMPQADLGAGVDTTNSVFAGTISSISTSVSGVQTAVANLTGSGAGGAVNTSANVLLASDVSAGATLEKGSGYYQYLLFQRFLESYVALKKLSTSGNFRLAFACWKDQEVYLVTPMSLNRKRTAGRPFEYLYTLQLKPWKRINLQAATATQPLNSNSPTSYTPGQLETVLDAVSDARSQVQTIAGIGSILQASVADAASVVETLRSLALFAEDGLGVSPTLADMPASVIQSMQPVVLAYISANPTIVSNLNQYQGNASGTYSDAFQANVASVKQLGTQSQKANVQYANPSGLGSSLGALGSFDATHPANVFFQNPTVNYELFSAISLGALNIPPAVSEQIVNEKARVRAYTRTDFANMRDNLVQVMADFCDSVGAGSSTYNATYYRNPPASTQTPTDDDFSIIFALNSVILAINNLAAFGRETIAPNPLDYVAGFARQFGLSFDNVTSKFSVPFPYGSTLEMLAARYLGDPDKWVELATLNGLQEPYVDEAGFSYPLLTNGSGNEVLVSTAANLQLNQVVYLSSTNTARTQRHIVGIRTLSSGTTVLTLDGDDDLARFTTIAQAQLQAFLPNTINSQMTIYIPSTQPATEEVLNVPELQGVNQLTQYFAVGGIDWLLTPTGDLAITPDGDVRLSFGLTNLIQKVWLAFNTPAKSLLHHPGYGFNVPPGTSVADLSANDLLAAAKSMVKGDPSYSGVTAAAIQLAPPVSKMAISIGIAGVNQLLSLTLDVK